MDNLADKLSQLLSDPGSLKQITQLASALSGSADQPVQIPEGLPKQLDQMVHETQRKDEKQEALVQALLPFLRPGHQARLQRAMELAKLSQLASAAWNSGLIHPAPQEVSHV